MKMPLFLDLFFFYARMLADRLAVALGPLVSEQPEAFPKRYKLLARAASMGNWQPKWKVKTQCAGIGDALKHNSHWYDLLTHPGQGGRKGVRDAITHGTVDYSITTMHYGFDEKPIAMSIQLSGIERDVQRVDALATVRSIMSGFCDLLSALPSAIWRTRAYHKHDTFLNGTVSSDALVKFFPELASARERRRSG